MKQSSATGLRRHLGIFHQKEYEVLFGSKQTSKKPSKATECLRAVCKIFGSYCSNESYCRTDSHGVVNRMQEISQVRKRESALASRCSKSCEGWILSIPAHFCLGRWIALGFLGLSTSWLPEPRKLFKKILNKVESGFYLQSRCQKPKFTVVYRIVTMEVGLLSSLLPPADGSNNDNNGNQVEIASNGPQPVDRQGVTEDDRIEDTSESAAQDTNAPTRVLDPIENAPNDQGQAPAQRANNTPKPAKLTGSRQYMEKTREGKQILDSYATYGCLKKTVRSSLVGFIIKREEDRAFKTIKAHEKLKKWKCFGSHFQAVLRIGLPVPEAIIFLVGIYLTRSIWYYSTRMQFLHICKSAFRPTTTILSRPMSPPTLSRPPTAATLSRSATPIAPPKLATMSTKVTSRIEPKCKSCFKVFEEEDEEEEGYSESISSDSDEEFGVDDSDYFSSDDFGNESLFERENVECAADFVSKLFMYPNIPCKTVTKVINDSSNLLDQLLDRISHEIVQVSKTDNLDPNTISVVRNLIETYKNPLETFNTDKKCLKYFAKSDTFVPPESYIIGERHDYRKRDGEMSLAHVPVCVQFIPLRKVLKKFLELPGLFERLTEYLQEITNLIGDNLGIHTICIYVQYFRTKFFCHLCLTEYCDISNELSEDDCVVCNPDNYSELLALNDPQISGMDGECELNKLDNFHETINIGEDVMNDWYEGNCRHDVAIALYNLIYEQEVLKLADLNSRLRSFYYGPEGSTNKPPEILDHQVKNKHLIMTSAEMHNLVYRLPMVIGMIVPENNKILQFLIQLKRIIDIISSKVVQPQTHNQLKVHISEYLEMRRELFEGEKEKPKHHLGLHGPSSMKKFGPLIKSSALRFEAKNQEGKVIARTARTRVNICRTIAIRHQLLLNYRLRLKKPQARIETSEKKSIVVSKLKDISEFYSLLPVHDPTAVVSTVKWINTGDDQICKNSILVLFDDGGPVFYLAHELIVIDDAVHIISKKLRNSYAVERIHGYKVVDEHDFCWSSLTLNDSRRASITYLTTLPDGGTYIHQNWIE
ncbi:hypothetical protein QAD02_018282 [Eretmocerus hayati]|uniref:Uncharacterized protein n=1 Tax=Eretmocerus hayati TaxID=131215 RepID=A0ACC2PGE2_9HYME|nr:hypothetical protein QAD02_018282 [Eretmocerus hayati]